MSYGAVLVSDIPENLEAISNAGFMFKNKDIKDLENKLRSLLENKEKVDAIKKHAKERVEDFYGWEMIVDNTLKVYNDACHSKKAYSKKCKNCSEISA